MNQGHPKWRPVRAWSIRTDGWVYGWYFRDGKYHFIIPFESAICRTGVSPFSDKTQGDLVIANGSWHLVEPDSVGLCVGKAYKDTTHEGHDVAFEGDILELKGCFYEIYWMEAANEFRLSGYDCRNEHDKSKDTQFLCVATYMGNQLENPELLRELQKEKEK